MKNQISVCILGVSTHLLVFKLISCVKWAKLSFTNEKQFSNNEKHQMQVFPTHIYWLALSLVRRYQLRNKYLYQARFLKKRNALVKKLRSPEFSFSEFHNSFLLFSYPLVMPKNYPRVILMKIVEVVIFLPNFDFFQKKYRFL